MRGVDVTISAARIAELLSLTEEALELNVLSRKWLRSYAGRANSFASILASLGRDLLGHVRGGST